MKNTLYCLPCGQSMREDFLAEHAARRYAYGDALFITPMGRRRRDWDIPAESGDFADFAAGFLRLNKRPVRLLTDMARRLLVRGLLQRLEAAGELNFFAGFAESDALAAALLSFMDEIACAGIEPDDFAGAARIFSLDGKIRAKDREVFIIYKAYETTVGDGAYDRPRLLQAAGRLLDGDGAAFPWRKVYIEGFYAFNALEMDIVRRLSRRCETAVALPWEEGREAVYGAAKTAYEDLMGLNFELCLVNKPEKKDRELSAFCRSLFSRRYGQAPPGGAVKVRKYANRRQEMQEAVADIKRQVEQGAPPGDILLATRNLSLYPGLRREFFLAGLPVSLPETVRLSAQPAARFAGAFLQVGAGEAKEGLKKLFSSYILKEYWRLDVEKIGRLLEENYLTELAAAKKLILDAFLCDGRQYALLEKLFAHCAGLPRTAGSKVFAQSLSDFLTCFFSPVRLGELYKNGFLSFAQLKLLASGEDETLKAITQLADDLKAAGGEEQPIPVGEYRRLFLRGLKDLTLVLLPGDDAGVRVADNCRELGNACRHVYIIGLKEKEFPALAPENWLYDDAERIRLAQLGFLPSLDSAAREEKFFFFNCVKRARQGLWLSASIADGAIISTYLEEALRALPGLAPEERPARAVLPAPGLIANEEVLASLLAGQKTASPPARTWLGGYLGEDFAARLAGELPRRAGAYAGDAAAVKESISALFALTFNASLLENYALCPFKFLLEDVWRPRAWRPAGDGLPAALKGGLYHACLKKFLQKHTGRRLAADALSRLAGELSADFSDLLQEYAAKGLLPQTWLTGRECSDMEKELSGWLAAEINYQELSGDFRPFRLEWKFDEHPLTLPAQAGEAKITGRIDRVDTDGNAYFVTDYKLADFPLRG
ncbi:MAG: PD-(D/E)XK nuclease family protein, partial [Acidaminococcales bacterium]|nr:PD-(D/E)XK nuclease family protein [Acidaminococcales bacterium]